MAAYREQTRTRILSMLPDDAVPLSVEGLRRAQALRLYAIRPLGWMVDIAVDFRRSPALFASLFPNYPDSMRLDETLWREVFSRNFGSLVMSDFLSSQSPYGVAVYHPLLDCLDIYRRYGADVLIIGASDTAQSLPPDLLARLLNDSNLPRLSHPRVLTCVAPGMLPDVVEQSADILHESGRRAKWVIYGYSMLFGYTQSPHYQYTLSFLFKALQFYRESLLLGPLRTLNNPFHTAITWDNVIPLRRSESGGMLGMMEERSGRNRPRMSIIMLPSSAEPMLSREYIADYMQKNHLATPFQEGLPEMGCGDFSAASATLARTLRTLNSLADRSLLFINPSTGFEMSAASDCYLRNERSMIAAMRNKATVVETSDMKGFGMEFGDFTYRRNGEGDLYMDVAHVNIRGARKVTRHVADLIIRAEKR